MAKKPTYTQLKAKKKWLLHTSSSRQKFKTKARLTSQKPRRSRSSSVGNEHISSSLKRTIFKSLSQISGLLQSKKGSEEVFKVSDFDNNHKWLTHASMGAVLLPINMVLCALMNGTQFFRHYFEATRKAIATAGESLNSGIKNGFKSVDTYQRKFVQSTTDVVFPTSSYKRKFEELTERINDLEKEIKKIKTSHSETICSKCYHGSATSVSSEEKMMPQAPPPPLPPPPPPPPPPLIQPPPPPLNLQLKKKPSASNSKDKPILKENTKALVVSIDDIKSVKLRKVQQKPANGRSPVNNEQCKSTRQPLKEIKNNPVKASGKPLVTMEELRGIKLRKKPTERSHRQSCFKTPENNMVVLRRNLKRVSHKRSPGGTPLDKTIQETGLGLTPMITRALRKKFQLANPPSASPEEMTSPRKRIRDISISPTQAPVFTSPSIR